MYQFIDQPLTVLDSTSRFLLGAIRDAAAALAERRCLGAALGPGFGRLGLNEALPHFAIAMAVLAREANQTVVIAKANCCRVTEHEALLLTLLTAADARDEARVHATAKLLVDDEASANTLHRALRTITAEVLIHGLMPARFLGIDDE